MNERWGDSQRDRDALDRWITREEFDGPLDGNVPACTNPQCVLPNGHDCEHEGIGL